VERSNYDRGVLSWCIRGGPILLSCGWTETGAPTVQQPSRRSFGSRLILLLRQAEQLHGEVRMEYETTGLIYELEAPLSALRERHANSINR